MRSRVHFFGRVRPVRKLLTALVLGTSVIVGMLALPGTALAIPPGGWCYDNWYVFGTNNGEVHQPYGSVKQMTNQTQDPVTWTESVTVSTTFTSTYTTTTTFHGGLDLVIIKFGVDSSTQVTTVLSRTVSETSTSQTTVNPGQTKYMAYGAFGLSTTGTYHQARYGCDYGDYYTTTSGPVTGFGLTTVGWRVWS